MVLRNAASNQFYLILIDVVGWHIALNRLWLLDRFVEFVEFVSGVNSTKKVNQEGNGFPKMMQ